MKVCEYLFLCVFILFVFSLFVLFFFTVSPQDECGTSFECGFSSFSSFVSPPFSFSFFIVSLMFLLFDVEVILLFFFSYLYSFSYYSFFFLWLLVLMVFFSTIYEWFKGLFVWL